VGEYLFEEFDPALIGELLGRLSVENALVVLRSQEL
jgi:hypothetical protein